MKSPIVLHAHQHSLSAQQNRYLNAREAAGKEKLYSPFDTVMIFKQSGNEDSIDIQ
jgi:hypothetical protein